MTLIDVTTRISPPEPVSSKPAAADRLLHDLAANLRHEAYGICSAILDPATSDDEGLRLLARLDTIVCDVALVNAMLGIEVGK